MREKGITLDDKDRKLLKLLYENSRATLRDLSREVGLSPSAVYKRLERLKKVGVRFTVRMDPKIVGKGTLAFVLISSTAQTEGKLAETLSEYKEICEVHEISSEKSGLLLKVRTRDNESLSKLKSRLSRELPGVEVRVLACLRTYKEEPWHP